MKKAVLFLSIVATLVVTLAAPVKAMAAVGDVNGDGQITLLDYQLIQPLFGKNTSQGDFNVNGIVDLLDVNTIIVRLYTAYLATLPPSPTATAIPTTVPTAVPTNIPTPVPTSVPNPTITPTPGPTSVPNPDTSGIGSIQLTYKQGGIWLTPAEIDQIPMDNDSWTDMVDWSQKAMKIESDIECTAGGACSGEVSPMAMLARAIVGMRLRNTDPTTSSRLISELKDELNKVPNAVNSARDNDDEKWPERNLGAIAAAANIIDYRPAPLLAALKEVLYERKFDMDTVPGGYPIRQVALTELPNKPSWGKWSVLATAYLLEDWNTVNLIVKAHARALGEKKWDGKDNDTVLSLTGMGEGDNWQTVHAGDGGKSNPLLIMPAGEKWNGYNVGGLYLADQYRAGNGPEWPPGYTGYIFEGMAPNNTVSWAADHLGYKDVHSWGNYALLRAMLFAYSSHQGKDAWPVTGPTPAAETDNDKWQVAAIMAWAKPRFGSNLPAELRSAPIDPSKPNETVKWPLEVEQKGKPGRSMGWMYATHYARLAR